MKLYRFSPITTENDFFICINYILEYCLKLSEKVTNEKLPLTYLTIFSHFEDEYDYLTDLLSNLGKVSDANNGIKCKLNNNIEFENFSINLIRIRKPDPYRMQVGCCDFEIGDYSYLMDLEKNSKNLRLIKREKYEMIEFFHPKFDVLGYVVKEY